MRKRSGVKKITYSRKGEISFWGKNPSENGRHPGRLEGGAFSIEFCSREMTYFEKIPAENTLFFRSDQLGYDSLGKEGNELLRFIWRYDETFHAKFETQSSP